MALFLLKLYVFHKMVNASKCTQALMSLMSLSVCIVLFSFLFVVCFYHYLYFVYDVIITNYNRTNNHSQLTDYNSVN